MAVLTQVDVFGFLYPRDLPSAMSRSEIEWLLRLEETCQHTTQKITLLEISGKTGQGLDQVARWIYENHKEPITQSHS